jgi:hypothetical protein
VGLAPTTTSLTSSPLATVEVPKLYVLLIRAYTISGSGIHADAYFDSCSATVRGAVLSQIPSEVQVVTNISPKHYGFGEKHDYSKNRDGDKGYVDEYSRKWSVDIMKWPISKGQALDRSRRIVIPLWHRFNPNPSDRELQLTRILRECLFDNAPLHTQDSEYILQTSGGFPITDVSNADRVTKTCNLYIDLSMVPVSQFQEDDRDEPWLTTYSWLLEYELLVTIQSGPMLFDLQCGGNQYGPIRVGYDY